jgi:hypothetical protein
MVPTSHFAEVPTGPARCRQGDTAAAISVHIIDFFEEIRRFMFLDSPAHTRSRIVFRCIILFHKFITRLPAGQRSPGKDLKQLI